jgi:hypothetical protein
MRQNRAFGLAHDSLAIARDGRFESFLVGTRAYHSGSLGTVQRAKVFLFEYYWLIALLVLVMALVIATELRRATERVAARRLAVNFTRGYST